MRLQVAHVFLETKFSLSFRRANPIILLTLLTAIVLNIFGHLMRPWSNTTLELLNLMLKTALGNPSTMQKSKTELDYVPCDIHSVREKFDLEPSTQTHATCVRCSCTYLPIIRKKATTYPERCSFTKYRGSKPCGQLLVKSMKSGNTRIMVPIRPFIVQDYNEFLASLFSRPGMEAAMECRTRLNDKYQLWDIKDGTGITEIAGPDSKPFMDGLQRSNLRLAWSLSINWFNPHGNKSAGKKKSVGSIAMALLNLPPSLQYKAENLYVVGIIPGPKEPSLDEVNHFLHPLVDFFLSAWQNGTWFTKTVEHPGGRLPRSVIVLAVNDLPAARKVMGFAGPTAAHLCNLCWLEKSEISNFACETWRVRTCKEYLDAANHWREAVSKAERDKVFKETGVRWSELLRLPYWDPTRFLVINGMHNLFLGIVQHHFRDLIIIDKLANQGLCRFHHFPEKAVTEEEIQKTRKLLTSGASITSLSRIRVVVLLQMVEEHGQLAMLPSSKKRPTKKSLINVLLVKYKLFG